MAIITIQAQSGSELDMKNFRKGPVSSFEAGHLYNVSADYAGRGDIVVHEDDTLEFRVIPYTALLCQMLQDDDSSFKPYLPEVYYPLPNSTLRCVSVDPLKFIGSLKDRMQEVDEEVENYARSLNKSSDELLRDVYSVMPSTLKVATLTEEDNAKAYWPKYKELMGITE